jgi:hypothetical protein
VSCPARAVLSRLRALPLGYSEGLFDGRAYGLTVTASADRRRWWLWAEDLGGRDRVSGNLYVLADGRVLLKPCEMAVDKVAAFVDGFRPRPGPEPIARPNG